MTSGEDFYEGSYEVLHDASEDGPRHPPEDCALCDVGEPRWWYEADYWNDGLHRTPGLAFARWWAVCSVCHELLLAEDTEALAARMQFDADFPRDLLPEFMRRAHLTVEIER